MVDPIPSADSTGDSVVAVDVADSVGPAGLVRNDEKDLCCTERTAADAKDVVNDDEDDAGIQLANVVDVGARIEVAAMSRPMERGVRMTTGEGFVVYEYHFSSDLAVV